MATDDHFPLIEVSGSAYARGLQHGEQARERVQRSVAIYSGALSALACDRQQLAQTMAQFTARIQEFDATYLDEMQGIADGAGVSFDDILIINARTEIVSLARRGQRAPDPVDGCTSFGVLPALSAHGEYFQGQNWDNRLACADSAIVLKVLRDDGPSLITFVEAGGLARYGMNAAGLALNGNGLESSRDFQQIGVPLPLIRRKALEQPHIALALQVITGTPKSCSCNLLLGSREGIALNLECAPDETFLLQPEANLLVHANHWTSTAALAKLADTGIPHVPDSVYRDWRLKQLLADRATLSVDDLKQALADTLATPYSLCRPARPNDYGDTTCTTATLLFEPHAGRMHIARKPFEGARYVCHELAMIPAADVDV